MNKLRFGIAFLAVIFVSCQATYAQKSTAPTIPVKISPDLSSLDLAKLLQEAQSTKIQTDGQEASPLQVVAEFLQLRPAQVAEMEQLLLARQATIAPLFVGAQTLTQQLALLLSSGGNPAQIGTALIQIQALQQKIAQVEQAFLQQFVSILDADQAQRLQAVQIAAQLQPVLPAFGPIFLF